tara:strand:- start:3966 stop:4796 length:831 start_codon:yes stop_codon:yes gene_type:complete
MTIYKKKIILITGDEIRHNYFYQMLFKDQRFEIVKCYAEEGSNSLEVRTFSNTESSDIEKKHVLDRKNSEIEYFSKYIDIDSFNNPVFKKIPLKAINNSDVIDEIIQIKPDILACYGSSLINSNLLNIFEGKFLNVHLGLSPYYRGSGTNIWPLINNQVDMVGLTFMYIDAGIDTGEIIHQVRADIFAGDTPHMIGNRLIKKMTIIYSDIIANLANLKTMKQPKNIENFLYKKKDFNQEACEKLYKNFSNQMIDKYLQNYSEKDLPFIVQNPLINN